MAPLALSLTPVTWRRLEITETAGDQKTYECICDWVKGTLTLTTKELGNLTDEREVWSVEHEAAFIAHLEQSGPCRYTILEEKYAETLAGTQEQ